MPIPALIVAGAAAAAGYALFSGDDDKKKTSTNVRTVSEDYVKEKMAKSGRQIKTVGVYNENRVKQIIAEQLGLDPNKIHMSDRIIEDLGADSLDLVELVMAFEEEFNIEIPEAQVKNFKTVENIFNYIR